MIAASMRLERFRAKVLYWPQLRFAIVFLRVRRADAPMNAYAIIAAEIYEQSGQ